MPTNRYQTSIQCPLIQSPQVPLCELSELVPLIAFLSENQPIEQQTTFPIGTLLEDGRLDLCKQGVGPLGMAQITKALKANTRVKHILVGTDGLGNAGIKETESPSFDGSKTSCRNVGSQSTDPYLRSRQYRHWRRWSCLDCRSGQGPKNP